MAADNFAPSEALRFDMNDPGCASNRRRFVVGIGFERLCKVSF